MHRTVMFLSCFIHQDWKERVVFSLGHPRLLLWVPVQKTPSQIHHWLLGLSHYHAYGNVSQWSFTEDLDGFKATLASLGLLQGVIWFHFIVFCYFLNNTFLVFEIII